MGKVDMQWPADRPERRKTESLIPYARNSRTHTDAQIGQIAASIIEWGFTTPILIEPDGGIIAGHGRVMAAQKLGLDEVPCIIAEGWSDAQKRAYVIADNKLALNAGWDFEVLTNEISALQEIEFDISIIGFGDAELETILGQPIDMSILDDCSDDEVDSFEENVRKAIQI